MQLFTPTKSKNLDTLQRFSLVMMAMLVLLTFVGTNMQALLWQSSDWLVSTVLPAVVIDLTNDERVDNAVAALQRNTTLDQAAQAKAQHMAANEYFAHFAPDGTTPWQFFDDEGYVYAHAGENLAIHFTDSSEVVEAWMLSPSHRKNIVDGKFTEIGVGTAKGSFDGYKTVYVVQLFGTPAIAPSVAEIIPIPVAEPAIAVDLVLSETIVETVTPPEVIEEPELASDETPIVLAQTNPVSETEVVPDVEQLVPVSIDEPAIDLPVVQTTQFDDVVVVETQLATSSGLAVATVVDAPDDAVPVAAFATRPNLVLQWLYGFVALLVTVSLLYALVAEARRFHYLQVVYSIGLLIVMGGLLWLHSFLVGGAIIA